LSLRPPISTIAEESGFAAGRGWISIGWRDENHDARGVWLHAFAPDHVAGCKNLRNLSGDNYTRVRPRKTTFPRRQFAKKIRAGCGRRLKFVAAVQLVPP